ncbi:MAG: hypothetical protein HFH53_07815 [Hespellia sp.]|nr:hypothetical protein [Hespellia sp.]
MLTYQDFCKTYAFENCQTNTDAYDVFDFLCDPGNIYNMTIFSDLALPAISGLVENLENTFKNTASFPLTDGQNRKIVGRMVKFILGHFGYTPVTTSTNRNKLRNFSNAAFFKTAAIYSKTKNAVNSIQLQLI